MNKKATYKKIILVIMSIAVGYSLISKNEKEAFDSDGIKFHSHEHIEDEAFDDISEDHQKTSNKKKKYTVKNH